ncbi:polysaccharide biosynthesis protein [Bizionia sp. KMM 8389]
MDKIYILLRKLSNRYASKWFILLFDSTVIASTFFLAHLIRYNFDINFDFAMFIKQIPFVIIAGIISFLLVSSHKGVVRFTGFKDVVNIIIGVNILATILIVTTYLSRKYNYNNVFDIAGSIIYIHLLLNMFFLIGAKFFIKSLYRSLITDPEKENNSIVLIYGAGDSGLITYNAIINDLKSDIDVFGFIDDNERKVGKKINLLNVYHPSHITKSFIEKNNIDSVIISIQNINSNRLLQITSKLFSLNLNIKIVPAVQTWIDGDLSIGQIKDIKIEDLLGREPILIDNPLLDEAYTDKIILITGSAGSIGSEIVRKLATFKFKKLLLLDNAESPLYDLQQELLRSNISNIEPIIADIRSKTRLEAIFNQYKPDIVFHAAAYKHVPLMENNPLEAVSVNVFGTENVVCLSKKYEIEKFILISTDKAVNPTNVMGATKRIAEMLICCQQESNSKTKFIITRFGNVLGSNGSVIPLFKKQIENGGPITVTHKDIIRYFMTIPEACSLVLEASAMGSGHEIFVFDMGKPIKIYDLALNMIALSGLKHPNDIDINIIGLRPGEKIYEELLIKGENIKPTYNKKIMIANCKAVNIKKTEKLLKELSLLNTTTQNIEIVSKIKDIVPEYTPNNSTYDVLN